MPIVLILTLILTFCSAVPALATNWYISPSGSAASGCTTSGSTRCSWANAISGAQPGDTIFAGNGTYTGPWVSVRGGTSDTARITITAENRRQATVNWGSSQSSVVLIRHSFITVRGLVLNADVTTIVSGSGATGLRVQPIPYDTGPQIVGVTLEDNQVTGPGGGCVKLDTTSTAVFTNMTQLVIRWNDCLNTRTEASNSATFGEAMYLGQYQGIGRIDGAEIYANMIIDPLLECFDIKDGSNNIQIHHNICDGSGRLTADGTPIMYRSSPQEETNTSWLATFEGPVTNSRVYRNIARHGRTQSYAGCGSTLMPQNTGVRFDHNVCRESLSPSSAIGGGLSDTSIWEIDNNVFCQLSSYANANTSPNLNIHNNQGFPGGGVDATVCDDAEQTILAEMQALPGNPSGPAAPGDTLIGSGADDAEQETVSGTTRINEVALDLGDSGGVLTAGGFYFRSLSMGKNATCNTATIQFTAAASPGTGSPVFDIKAEASMTPAALAATANNLTGRTYGSAISWSPGAWSANTADAASTTQNLCSILQPLFNNASWVPGTHVMIEIFPTGGSGSRVVKPVDQGGVTRLSINFTDTIPAPGVPSVTALGSFTATYTWTAAAGATGYNLYTCTPVPCDTGTAVPIGNFTTVTVTNLSPSITYDVRVAATQGASISTHVGPVEFQTYAEGLVGYWAADVGGGTNLPDTGRGLSPGTLSSVTWTSDSKSGGQALVCDDLPSAQTDYISLPTTGMNPAKGSILFWLKPTSFPPTATRYYLGTLTSGPANRLQLYHDGVSPILKVGFGSSHTALITGPTLTASTWSHVALTWNGTTCQLIMGGSLFGSSFSCPGLSTLASTLDICNVGADQGHDEGALAIIDEIRTYDKALTDTDVLAIINTGLPVFTLTAVPPKVVTGQTSVLVWPRVVNATSCTASVTSGTDAGWTGNPSMAGGTYVAPTPSGATGSSTTYQLSCTGAGGGPVLHTATVTKDTAPPYPYSTLATITFQAPPHAEFGVGSVGADDWRMTWASDGNIYGFFGDGTGWAGGATPDSYFGVTTISGTPPGLTGTDIYFERRTAPIFAFDRKPSDFVALGGNTILGYFNTKDKPGETPQWDGTWAMSSSSLGTSWTDPGSKVFSVVADGVRIVSLLKFGQAYSGLPAPLDPAYLYGVLALQNGETGIGLTNAYLARIPVATPATRSTFQYFNNVDGSSNPIWSTTYANKTAIFSDPNGQEYSFEMSWWPAQGRFIASKGYQSSGLGVFEAPTPWGPWRTLYYGQGPIDTVNKFTYQQPQKWMDPLGASFWMSYSGVGTYDSVSFMKVDMTALPATVAPPDTTPPQAPTNLRVVSP